MLALTLPMLAESAEIYRDFPGKIDRDERYVIFSHGLIAEGLEERPMSPRFGVYDFPGIRQALFADGGFNLIAYQRPRNAEFNIHALQIEAWVRRLLLAGVKPSRITIVGFSRGSTLTAHASARLRDTGINTALLASCFRGDIKADPPLVLGGNLLSIYETSDEVLTCDVLAKRSKLQSFEEVAISTGRQHGAFFEPRAEWIEPLKRWIARTNR
jgi:pimeloyl-ACP methyl ester carboxylesterase